MLHTNRQHYSQPPHFCTFFPFGSSPNLYNSNIHINYRTTTSLQQQNALSHVSSIQISLRNYLNHLPTLRKTEILDTTASPVPHSTSNTILQFSPSPKTTTIQQPQHLLPIPKFPMSTERPTSINELKDQQAPQSSRDLNPWSETQPSRPA